MSRFQFVDDYATTYSVKRLCHVLNLNRSSFYKWRDGKSARRQRQHADEVLVVQMRDYHDEFDATIGVRRMHAEINEHVPTPVNHKRIERLMRQHQIVGVNLRKRKRTTIPDQDAKVFDDLVGRDLTAEDCNQLYIGDITYLPCGKGDFMYLATVIDVHSRRLVGYSLADHMRTSLVQDAIKDAARTRGAMDGAIFHSDHSSVYASSAFQDTCIQLGIRQSMGRIGSSADNAMAESFNASLKRETLQGSGGWVSSVQCRREVFRWITRYNTRRRRSGISYLSPRAFEDTAAVVTVAPAA
ncbi:hypothetical protein B841_02005 [Corynebacterium maris DSM 45190]|uniref:Integrase catalytic domain-containing protein n=1 Tax=Corynebacterium maris DSM 45190 TaxID=1224163 RepID=S5SRY6_9CORY|nr:hypothetical protein B841_02005 [Corynebacterium maris DSM 45190]